MHESVICDIWAYTSYGRPHYICIELHWINVYLTVVHCLRRCTSVKPTFIKRIVFAGKVINPDPPDTGHVLVPSKYETLAQRWFTVGPPSTTLAQQ